MRLCEVDGCWEQRRARGLCNAHYKRLMKWGTVYGGGRTPRKGVPAEVRFGSFFKRRAYSDCWPWRGAHNARGYGTFGLGRGSVLAHRFMFEMEVGPIPEGYDVHHRCGMKYCVNPRHLFSIEHGAHTLISDGFGGANARKTHCVRGHALVRENCYPEPWSRGRRVCALCARERARRVM